MKILFVGLVLAVLWTSTTAMPAGEYTENDVKRAFLQGVLFGSIAIDSGDLETEDANFEKADAENTDDVKGDMEESVYSQAAAAEKFKPIFKFDGQQSKNCYPDWATSANNGNCENTLHSNVPVYYQTNTCSGTTVYTYWLWYGWQNNCDCCSGAHDDDWEHISVYVKNDQIEKVVFFQHKLSLIHI